MSKPGWVTVSIADVVREREWYPALKERVELETPCVLLGHFYEEHECIYCEAKFCATERGGHSFEVDGGLAFTYSKGKSPLYCHTCGQNKVNIHKG